MKVGPVYQCFLIPTQSLQTQYKIKSNRGSGSAVPLCRSVGTTKETVLVRTGCSEVTPDTNMGTLGSPQAIAALM